MSDFAAGSSTDKKVSGPLGQKSSILPELSAAAPGGVPNWGHFLPIDHTEVNNEWQGRQRIETVQAMLNHWQVAAIRQAIRLPASTYVIELDPGEIDPVAASLLAIDLDVPLVGDENARRPGLQAHRFSSRAHFGRVLDALDYGHAVFEQSGYYDAAGYWRLQDLSPVPQWTIDLNSWEVDDQGHLINVIQWMHNPPVTLPVDHLTVFAWQGAPGDPRGRSMLRPLFLPWTLSDRLIRVMAMSGERTGMGIPVGKVAPGSGPQVKQKMVELLGGMAAGNDSCLVLETDEHIEKAVMLMGVTGTTPDVVGMLSYIDTIMARASLAMLLNLSQGPGSTGSYALSGTFDDLLSDYHDTVLEWYCDVMSKQLIEAWLMRNRSPEQLADVVVPRLVWKRREVVEPTTAAPTALPATTEPTPASVSARRRSVSSHARRAQAARASFATAAGRDMRRDPMAHELAAATDFAELERQHVAAADGLAAVLVRDRDELAATAVALIETMLTVDPLTLAATLGPELDAHATAMDTGPIVTMLTATASQGVSQVVGEAARQGVSLTASIDYTARAELEASELLRRMAAQITEACAARARTLVQAPPPVQAARTGLRRLLPARLAVVEDTAAVALAIKAFLESLSPAPLEASADGASGRANGLGRYAAMDAAPVRRCYVSALLDANVCGPCEERDGEEFDSVAEATAEFPNGPNPLCEGMERCRCVIVAIMDDEQPTLA